MANGGFLTPFDLEQSGGVLLIAILLNAYLFGVVSQQLYLYWVGRFEDPVYVKVFVVAQFVIIILQSALLCYTAWNAFVIGYRLLVVVELKSIRWQAAASSSCQLVLVLMANAFQTVRIHSLTHSRLQSGLVSAFSVVSFIVGVVTIVTTWAEKFITGDYTATRRTASVVWHALQAITECLIMFFFARALMASRSGLNTSDSIVNHLVRKVIQIGLFTTAWATVALGTFFLFPQEIVYSIFDVTSGSIYTHMIYDGLLSRTRLRNRLAEACELDVVLPWQSLSHISHPHTPEEKQSSDASEVGVHGAVCHVTITDSSPATRIASESLVDPSRIDKDTKSEFESEPVGKPAAGYDLPL